MRRRFLVILRVEQWVHGWKKRLEPERRHWRRPASLPFARLLGILREPGQTKPAMISSRTTTRTTGPLNGTRSACHGHTGDGRRYHIEDVAVDWLLDQIFRERKDMAALRGSDLRLEVITWKPLVVAADRSALLGSLCLVIQRMVLPGTELLLRVYPSHDDICVTLEVERHGDGDDGAPMPNDCREARFSVAANALRRMGGDLEVATGRRGGCLVRMWLPQWIPDPHAPV